MHIFLISNIFKKKKGIAINAIFSLWKYHEQEKTKYLDGGSENMDVCDGDVQTGKTT